MLSVDTSWLIALVIGLLTFYFVKYYLDIKRFPPGPFPLPVIGSLLVFLKHTENLSQVFNELAKKYNGLYTLWVGSVPFVFVANWEMTKEGLVTKRNDIISRPNLKSLRHMLTDIDALVFHENNKQWLVCRKVAFYSIRKFSDSAILARIVHENVVEMLDKMLAMDGPINPKKMIQNTIFDIIAQTAFGTKKLSESAVTIFRNHMELFHENMMTSPGDFFPILSPLFSHIEMKIAKHTRTLGDYLHMKFQESKTGYQSNEIKHFADSIMWAKNEADEKDSANKPYLTDHNMKNILSDLFLAGTDTSTMALQWIFLALAQFPNVQSRIREEVLEQIGTRVPEQEDRRNCPYTWAFISEILRMRPPAPMLLPHATCVDTELGGRKIPKGTTVIFNTNTAHLDPAIWEEPEKLKPERFLDGDGKYNNSRMQGYLVFGGEGKRNCIGEKMARNDLFLIITGFLQKNKIKHSMNSQSLEGINNPFFSLPKDYEISVEMIST